MSKLTSKKIESSKPSKSDKVISDGNGLYLLIKKNGSKIFFSAVSIPKKRKRIYHGSYPAITLNKARELNLMAKEIGEGSVLNNLGPLSTLDKRSYNSDHFKNQLLTYQDLWDDFYEKYLKTHRKNHLENNSAIRRYVYSNSKNNSFV